MNNKTSIGLGVVAVILASFALILTVHFNAHKSFGASTATTNLPSLGLATIAVGPGCGDNFTTCTAADLALIKPALCTPTLSSADFAASSTVVGICTDATFVATDKVQVTQKLSTQTGLSSQGQIMCTGIVGTTSGQFGVLMTNLTGAATTSTNGVYRTCSYEITR